MSKFLTKFETSATYDAAKGSLNKPNVSYIVETLGVAYNPVPVPEMVDLGLPSGTKWMAYNLGAEHGDTKESWYGNFYAFGETQGYTASQVGTEEGKKAFSWADYEMVTSTESGFERNKSADQHESFPAYNAYTKNKGMEDEKTYHIYQWGAPKVAIYAEGTMTDLSAGWVVNNNIGTVYMLQNIQMLDAAHDAVSAIFGTSYHMPTKAQLDELKNGTNHSWVTNYNGISGLKGRVFTSKTDSSKSIFIPAAGYAGGGSVYGVDSNCGLWSREVDSDNPGYAWNLSFSSVSCGVYNNGRCSGQSVRGVK